MNSRSSSSGLPQEPQARQSSTPSSPPGAQANISPDQLQHYHTSLNEYISQAREHAQALRASYTNEVYELWHQHISTSAATDEASIASGSLTAQQLEDLTRKWVRLMRESRDMLHHESTIAAARAAVETKPPPSRATPYSLSCGNTSTFALVPRFSGAGQSSQAIKPCPECILHTTRPLL